MQQLVTYSKGANTQSIKLLVNDLYMKDKCLTMSYFDIILRHLHILTLFVYPI